MPNLKRKKHKNKKILPASDTDNILEVKGLKKYFDVTRKMLTREREYLKAVDGLDFHVKRGETLGIVGESGCGKTTTGNLILNLLEPTEGDIIFEGKELGELSDNEMRELRQDIQIIFQDPFSSLNPRMRVKDIVAEPLKNYSVYRGKELEEQVYELLEVVGLQRSVANRYPHEFSGGQRQRIGIARAIALRPKLIICDEPVSALDVSIQSQVLNLLMELQEELNLTYIFIAHGLPAVKYISDRIAVMYLGKIVEIAEADELFERPLHPYTEGLLAAVPIPDPRQKHKQDDVLLEGDIPSPVNKPTGCSFHTRCLYATDKCREIEPKLTYEENGHGFACHYPLKYN